MEGQIEASGQLGMKLYGLAMKTGQEGMLLQWAEELGELQHEVLKLARIFHGKSPTPETRAMVEQKIREEMVDVMICQRGCGFSSPSLIDARKKIERWEERMNGSV